MNHIYSGSLLCMDEVGRTECWEGWINLSLCGLTEWIPMDQYNILHQDLGM